LWLGRGLLLGRGCGSLLGVSIASSSSGSGRLSRVRVLLVVPALQSLEADLGDGLVEGLALGSSELQLLLGGLAGTVTSL
jgi:hypothetical protein